MHCRGFPCLDSCTHFSFQEHGGVACQQTVPRWFYASWDKNKLQIAKVKYHCWETSPSKFKSFFSQHTNLDCDVCWWCVQKPSENLWCRTVHTINWSDVLQILWSKAVVQRITSRTLIVRPHHWLARSRVDETKRVTKLMEQHCEQVCAFIGWVRGGRREGRVNAEVWFIQGKFPPANPETIRRSLKGLGMNNEMQLSGVQICKMQEGFPGGFRQPE